MDTVKDLAQIIYYIALSVAGPLALIEYFRSKKREQLEKEYNTYNELDNRFFDYQKLALEHYDLDILDVPNNDPSLAFDKKRKQEIVAYTILFSLFQRAFLMFRNQAEGIRLRQWSGWKLYLSVFIHRPSVRTAWQLSRTTYDSDFQAFMDAKIAEVLAEQPACAPKPVVVEPAPEQPVSDRIASIHLEGAAEPTAPARLKPLLSPIKKNTMWNLVVYAAIGLLAGAAARMLYPGRQPVAILGTIALGALGGVLGGIISCAEWPEVDSQFQAGNLIVSIIGAFAAIAVGAGISYARAVRGYQNPAR